MWTARGVGTYQNLVQGLACSQPPLPMNGLLLWLDLRSSNYTDVTSTFERADT